MQIGAATTLQLFSAFCMGSVVSADFHDPWTWLSGISLRMPDARACGIAAELRTSIASPSNGRPFLRGETK
jgi:hypothetical protein